jgi:NADH dehydrogenase
VNQSGESIVIIGGGFGGLEVALSLARSRQRVTLVDRCNYHLFQPLLYQVATGGLSPGDITSPMRAVLKKSPHTRVLMGEVVDILPDERRVVLRDGEIGYDRLVVATGVRHHYFGNDDWECNAPGLKTVEDALEIRRRILRAFEAAERTEDRRARAGLLRFVIVGGGPTGVELAGAIGELANSTMKHEFKSIDPGEARILLIEGTDRVLPPYPPSLSRKAARSLEKLGVTIVTGAMVTSVDPTGVTYEKNGEQHRLASRTKLWAAGVQASPLGGLLAQRTGASLDRAGRVRVRPDLSIEGHPEILVIGDLASLDGRDGNPLPGVAPVAMQQGRYAAGRLAGKIPPSRPFSYRDRGSLAVIGRNAAVAVIARLRISGFPAWLLWVFVHIAYLIEYDNRILVLTQWAINYFTRKRGARLITNEARRPLVADGTESAHHATRSHGRNDHAP